MNREYFEQLNYTLGNEDSTLEMSNLARGARHVVAVAGSGSRVLPLLARQPRRVTCVDSSLAQLRLTELRIESARALRLHEYLAFWGYPPRAVTPSERRALFERIALRPDTAEACTRLLESVRWGPLLYVGRWERTMQRSAGWIRRLMGGRLDELFACRTLGEQLEFMERRFPRLRWALVVWLLGNARYFNTALYKGRFPRKNIPQSHFEFYRSRFERLFRSLHARKSWFLQMVLLGEIRHPEARPIECRSDVYHKIRSGLSRARVDYVQGDVLDVCASGRDIDFVSLSDVPSYFTGSMERDFLQRMMPGLAARACIVARSYLHVPENVDTTGFETQRGVQAVRPIRECTQMYQVDIYERDPASTDAPPIDAHVARPAPAPNVSKPPFGGVLRTAGAILRRCATIALETLVFTADASSRLSRPGAFDGDPIRPLPRPGRGRTGCHGHRLPRP